MSVAEKQVALRLAALHPADQAWILARLETPVAARVRTWLRDALVIAAARLDIAPSEVAPIKPVADESPAAIGTDAHASLGTVTAHPAWAAFMAEPDTLPPALAASVSRYRASHAAVPEAMS